MLRLRVRQRIRRKRLKSLKPIRGRTNDGGSKHGPWYHQHRAILAITRSRTETYRTQLGRRHPVSRG